MNKFPYEEEIAALEEDEEMVVFINEQPFIIKKATDDEIERIGHGYFCMD
ncbi:hypothetical protein [Paenibacillus silvisoli]|nr:hypothetical protein [Paenibacillus silvisoli]